MVDIVDDDGLYRRLAPNHLRFDGSVSSSAFKVGKAWDNQISVDLAKLTTPEEAVARARRPETAGLGILTAGFPRGLGFTVRHDPLLENSAHTLIEGENSRQKSLRLAEEMRILVRPASVPLP